MLKQKRFWIPILSVLVIAMGCGLFYGRKVANQAPVKVYKPVDVQQSATPKPPPPGETAENGHWHGDEWHAEPHDTHAPAEVSEVDAELATPPADRTEVQGAPVGAPPINAQTGTQGQDSSQTTLEDPAVARAWRAWSKKMDELSEESARAGRAHTALLPGTEDELERYKADPEWQRKLNEALAEAAKASVMLKAHMAKNPLLPRN